MSSAKRRHFASHQWGNFYKRRFLLNFIQWREFENLVCKVAVIVSRPNWVTRTPLRQWCGWNSTQHQTWRRALREEFVHASILCWIELYCFGVCRYFWKRTNKCVAELETLGGKNSPVFNACNSGLMLCGKSKIIRGMLVGKLADAGWKLYERVWKR